MVVREKELGFVFLIVACFLALLVGGRFETFVG